MEVSLQSLTRESKFAIIMIDLILLYAGFYSNRSSCNISSIDNTTNSATIPCKNGTIEWLNPEGSKTLHFYQNGQMFRLCLSLRDVFENARVSLFLVEASKYNITPIVQSDPSVPTCFGSYCGHVKLALNATSNQNPLAAAQDSLNLKYNMYTAHDGEFHLY